MLETAELLTLIKKLTIDSNTSKIVWRHVKAIVNPKVILINKRTCLLSSFLNLLSGIKKLLSFLLIFVKKIKKSLLTFCVNFLELILFFENFVNLGYLSEIVWLFNIC